MILKVRWANGTTSVESVTADFADVVTKLTELYPDPNIKSMEVIK